MNKPAFLPYGRHVVDEDDVAAVTAALRGDWLTTGPSVDAFERAFAERVEAAEAVVCNSGTAALHLALAGAGIGQGDAVIVPALTFLATANAARFVGADVIFADVDPDTGLMRIDHLQDAIGRAGSRRPRAVMAVHLGGHIADMPALSALAGKHGLIVIEDACHAVGGAYQRANRHAAVGACTDSLAACFSFHPVKAIAMGEGGAVTTNDKALGRRLRQLRSHGMEREADRFENRDLAFTGGAANPWYYEMQELGWNYRAPDINCALALSQLKKLDGFLAKRRALADLYDMGLAPLAPLVQPVPRPSGQSGGWHLYRVLIDFESLGVTRADVMQRLHGAGIGTQVHYLPVHQQPYYRRLYGAIGLPGADAYYRRCLSLPLYPDLTEADVARVISALSNSLGR